MNYTALIVAAGKGSRMGLDINKVYAKLPDGKLILEKTIDVFMEDAECTQIIVVCDSEDYMKYIPGPHRGKILLARGGKTRQESVHNGLLAVGNDVVMIHDGARPFITEKNLKDLKKTMETEEACLLTVPCKDTIKKVIDGYIVETYERSTLASAQTPQVFKRKLIDHAMECAIRDGYTGTDDASLVEKYTDAKIRVVEGSYENFKITTPEDLK